MVAERFQRPPKIAAEYEALPDEDDPEFLAQLDEASLEVVIIARRATEDPELRGRIDSIIGERGVELIDDMAVKWHGAPKEEEDEVKGVARFLFWQYIQGGESYFEKNAKNAAITVAKQAGKKVLRRKQRARERDAIGRDPADFPESRVGDPYRAIEASMLVDSALRELRDEDQREAITLRYRAELPIFSQNPAEPTVASE